MKPLGVEALKNATRGLLVCGSRDLEVTGISTDTRTIQRGDLFIALTGERFEGHEYVKEALDKGAAGAVYSKDFPIFREDTDRILIKVDDTLTALGDIARLYRQGLQATVVAITGSNGKTTTKEMTKHLLEEAMETVASPASFNNFIGVPLTLFQADSSTKVVILEMGTNHPGEIARLAQIASPDVAAVLNVGRTHLEGFGSVDAVAAAKAELIHSLDSGGTAILNADCPYSSKMAALAACKVFTFGLDESADVFASELEEEGSGFEFLINGSVKASLQVPGRHNVQNALAALGIGRRLGLDLKALAERLRTFTLPSMRLEETSVRGALVINDAYNANPESMAAAIAEFARRKAKRKFFVFADMLELGHESTALHGEMGSEAARAGFDFYLALGDESESAVRAILEAGVEPERARRFDDVSELATTLRKELAGGDAVLLKGSRAMGLERVIDLLG